MHLSQAQGLARLYQTASTAMRQLSPRPTRWPRTLGVGWPRRVGGRWPGQGCAYRRAANLVRPPASWWLGEIREVMVW